MPEKIDKALFTLVMMFNEAILIVFSLAAIVGAAFLLFWLSGQAQ